MSLIARAAEAREQNRGMVTIVALALLTAFEYVIAVGVEDKQFIVTALAVIAVVKAVLIVEYFMHLSEVWRREHR